MNILIVEDHRDIAENLADYLEPAGHQLDFADNGQRGLELATHGQYDVIVLDVMMPGMDGMTLCRRLREEARIFTPVLMLTARDQLADKVAGFDAGADDYLVKPFSMKELDVRLQALVRRGSHNHTPELMVGDLAYNTDTLEARRAGVLLELNPIQRRILELLIRNTHRVVTRRELEQHVWGEERPDHDVLRTHIYALRNIIDRPFSDNLLHTVHGTGYRLTRAD